MNGEITVPGRKKSGESPRLVLVGDVAIEFADCREQMRKIAPYFKESAISFCNCEWPLTNRGAPWPGKAGRVVRSSPDKILTYTYCGFDVVSLANNHIMNYGPDGLRQTIDLLDKAGIKHCGAGANLAAAHRPAFVRWKKLRVAFLGYTSVFTPGFEAAKNRPGMAVIRVDSTYRAPKRLNEVPGLPMEIKTVPRAADMDRLCEDIAGARKRADEVVVSIHWGVAGGHQHLVGYQKDVGRAAIDTGAKLVLGHGPHTLQPIELYKGGLIAYSVGQCGFDMVSTDFTDESIAIEVPLEGGGFGKPLVRPIGNSVFHPEILDIDRGRSCLEWLARLSRPMGTTWRITGDAAEPMKKGGRASFV